jgi:anti-anti-sigma factor
MKLKTMDKEGIRVVQLQGNLDGNSAPQVQEVVEGIMEETCRLVMDLSGCGYVSSAGLRLLLMIGRRLSEQRGCWGLTGISEEVSDVMEMTGFSRFFNTYDTLDRALQEIGKEMP